ncbi:MAG: sigma 54-interacting transcriptional regulator [bacterium]
MTRPALAVHNTSPGPSPGRSWQIARPSLREELDERSVDPALQDLICGVRRAARSSCPITIQGESGVGKEYFARRVHELKWGLANRFECLHGAELRAERLAAALFGAERALRRDASPLTLYIRNPDLLPPATQHVFNEWMERHSGTIGGVRPLLIAARSPIGERWNHRSSWSAPPEGRSDSIVLTVPPLRSRAADVLFVVSDLIGALSAELRMPVPTISASAWRRILRNPWHGNVRELLNCLRQAMLLSEPGRPLVIRSRD